MDASQLENVVVSAAAIATGVVLMTLPATRYPAGWHKSIERLGRARRWIGAAVVVGGVIATLDGLHARPAAAGLWLAQTHTTLDAGPFTAPIPRGWRDVAEFRDRELVGTITGKLPDGARMLIHEDLDHDDTSATIMLWWQPVPAGAVTATCADQAHSTDEPGAQPIAAVTESKRGGDRVCAWTYELNDRLTRVQMQAHGADHVLVLQCARSGTTRRTPDATCDQLAAALVAR